MEINAPGLSNNLFYRNDARNARPMELPVDKPDSGQAVFPVDEDADSGPDFSAITPRDLRDVALSSYNSGRIGTEEYGELSADLPSHTIDAYGQLVDLSDVTDDTSFDFKSYFNDRFEIAKSVGDPQKAEILQSVVDFLTVG